MGTPASRAQSFSHLNVWRFLGLSGFGAAGVDAVVDGVEHAPDQEGPPGDRGPSLADDRLDVVERQARPGRGEVEEEFQVCHGSASSCVTGSSGYAALGPRTPFSSVVTMSSVTCAAESLPAGLYQNPIQFSAPNRACVAITGSEKTREPSALPAANTR